jgi:hypothetical protein
MASSFEVPFSFSQASCLMRAMTFNTKGAEKSLSPSDACLNKAGEENKRTETVGEKEEMAKRGG